MAIQYVCDTCAVVSNNFDRHGSPVGWVRGFELVGTDVLLCKDCSDAATAAAVAALEARRKKA